MNPSAWSNPPPPGIDMDEESKHSTVSSSKSVIDQIDPFIKNPEYIKYKKSMSKERGHHRKSRSHSRTREKKRRHHSRSRSRGRRRRSRSRSRGRRHHRHSHSSSRSRSSSHERKHRHKKRRSRRYSRSRSRSRSRNNRYKRSRRTTRSRTRSQSPSELNDSFADHDPATDGREDDDELEPTKENAFKNDGTFLEMFKKLQEEKEKADAEKAAAAANETKKPLPAFGKRRGGRVLKTGMVEKTKTCDDDDLSSAQDPWSIYLKEVKKYKEACCDDDSKTRPLVK